MMNRFFFAIVMAAVCLAQAMTPSAAAKNVDLSTVPNRDTVQLTIYNSEDITLVRETRVVSFKKGANGLQFSWANTLIDPSSVEIRFLEHGEKLELLDTTFPHDKPQMLYWNIASEHDGDARVEITYFTSGISWSADYVCIANPDESAMGFEGFVRVYNHSGEDYEDAQVRLVVGTINLVEKIAQLARVPMGQVETMDDNLRMDYRKEAAKMMFKAGDKDRAAGDPAAPGASRAKEIVKEGLSEYFIYTIDGTETISNGWSKRMRSFEGQTVPFKIQYRYRPREYGDQLVRMFILTNDEESKLGTTPLPDGVVRTFRSNDVGGLSFLAAQQVKYVPIGDKIELNLGADRNVIFELVKTEVDRNDIWMQIRGANVFRQIGGGIEIDPQSTVAGWDDVETFNQRIRNYSGKDIEVEVRRSFGGHAMFRSDLNPTLHDYQTVQYTAKIETGEQRDLMYEVVTKQGRNAKQNHVTLVPGKVE